MQKRVFRILSNKSGFTIVELLVVLVVIGILATMIVVIYSGIKAKAVDASSATDAENMHSSQMLYKLSNGSSPKEYYSGNGPDSSLHFTPMNGDIVDVTVSSKDYCIRVYNPGGSKNSIYNAYTKESTQGICTQVLPSVVAIAESTGLKVWSQLSASYNDTCGIASDSKAYCWGLNDAGQLGNGTTDNSSVPVAVDTNGVLNGLTIKSISTGSNHTCVVASDNNAYCWGASWYGGLGNGVTGYSAFPVAVNTDVALNGKTIKSVSANGYHTCAIASDNLAYCWGWNSNGQLGNSSITDSSVPVAVNTADKLAGKTVKSITASSVYGTCAIASDNLAYCWGRNNYGQLGNSSNDDSWVPVAVNTADKLAGKTVKSITAGEIHTCAIASDNKAYCWGSNWFGELGNATNSDSWVPVAVNTDDVLAGKTVKSIANGVFHSCAIASDNLAYCWGANSSGQLGDYSNDPSNVPIAVDTTDVLREKTIISIAASSGVHTCVVASNNNAYCWGSNAYGELGNNATLNSTIPVAVQTMPN